MHRMLNYLVKTGLTLVLAATLGPADAARADLLRPNAAQSFPDLAGDAAGAQNYSYNNATRTGTFVVNNAPSILALGTGVSGEALVDDAPGQVRGETIQVKLDSAGHLVNDPANSFSVYGSVTIAGENFSGLLLQGTPTGFGWSPTTGGGSDVARFDLNVSLTGGLLKERYGPDAYIRIASELDRQFHGDFHANFLGRNATTNVRAQNTPRPSPVPESSAFAILLACSGAGLLYHQRRRIDVAALTGED